MPAACLTCQLCLKTEPPTAEINPALIVFERCLNLQTKHLVSHSFMSSHQVSTHPIPMANFE